MSDTGNNDLQEIADQEAQQRYLVQRLRVRRRMAIIAFAQLVIGGAAIIIGGLIIPAWAVRIDHMATFLSIYFGALATVVGAYWGIGAMEHNSYMGRFGSSSFGSPYGSPYGGSSYDSGPRPRLTKNPKPAGVE